MQHGHGYAGFDPEQKTNGRPSSTDAPSETGTRENDSISSSKFYERSKTAVEKKSETPHFRSSLSSVQGSVPLNSDKSIANSKRTIGIIEQGKSSEEFAPEAISVSANNHGIIRQGKSSEESSPKAIVVSPNDRGKRVNEFNSLYSHSPREKKLAEEDEQINDARHADLVNVENKMERKDIESDDHMGKTSHFSETKLFGNVLEGEKGEKEAAVPLPSNNKGGLTDVKSVERHDSVKGNELRSDIYAEEKERHLETCDGLPKKDDLSAEIERKEPQVELSDCKNEWKMRVDMLEEELREAAATEIGLYSTVAEHASSANKVHTPARRLSRFYTNACKAGSQGKRASAARAAVSGLVLVSKSCGHDVPRYVTLVYQICGYDFSNLILYYAKYLTYLEYILYRLTFWLSNVIMLRAIVSKTAAEFPHSDGTGVDESDDREDVSTFITALEKVESWLFSRTVESLWWQVLFLSLPLWLTAYFLRRY